MSQVYQYRQKDLIFIIGAAMVFSVCEALSLFLNNYFDIMYFFGVKFFFNVSLIFFCISFFLIDIITEIYDVKIATWFIYCKILSQTVFVLSGAAAMHFVSGDMKSVRTAFSYAPYNLVYAIIATYLSYSFTIRIMSHLKYKYRGRFLFLRYMASTMPGEVVFSFVFALLAFHKNHGLFGVMTIFVDLVIVKLVLSIIFSMVSVPLTRIVQVILNAEKKEDSHPLFFD